MEYLPALRTMLTLPLIRDGGDGIPSVVSLMDKYDLLREDFDSILEVTSWTGLKDPMSLIDSKVKAAFTRTYNKEVHMTPYASGTVAKKGKRQNAGNSGDIDEIDEETGEAGVASDAGENDDDDLNLDSMIKVCCLFS